MSLFTACAQFSQYSYENKQEDLQTKIYQFNKRFEAKMMDLSASYLPINKRRIFLIDSLKIKENVIFYDSSILGVQLFDGKLPVQIQVDGPEKEFNKAIVTMRYQMAVLPSNQIKTIFIDQLWLWKNKEWYVVPDLDEFFQ